MSCKVSRAEDLSAHLRFSRRCQSGEEGKEEGKRERGGERVVGVGLGERKRGRVSWLQRLGNRFERARGKSIRYYRGFGKVESELK